MYDVIIIGGSYAGLSAAMSLGRSLKKTLIIDNGKPCNRQTPHSHNFLTRDGQAPAEILSIAQTQLQTYDTITLLKDLATTGKQTDDGFEITTASNHTFATKKLIIATGIKDTLPDIPGFAECWGISAIHCPYCHGYEYRYKNTGILAKGDTAFHLASLVHNLTDKLTILTNGNHDFTHEQQQKLTNHSIKIQQQTITKLKHNKGHLEAVLLNDGSLLKLEALYAPVPFTQTTNIPLTLGCDLTEQGYLKVDSFQKTTTPGIYACGDNASSMRAIANAVYTGNLAGAMVNMELTHETF